MNIASIDRLNKAVMTDGHAEEDAKFINEVNRTLRIGNGTIMTDGQPEAECCGQGCCEEKTVIAPTDLIDTPATEYVPDPARDNNEPPEGFGYWDNHPDFSLEDWLTEVANEETRSSYWGWVNASALLEGALKMDMAKQHDR